MEKNTQSLLCLFGPEIQKEISKLPQELSKKKKEIENLKKEIFNIKEKLKIIDYQLKKINNELIKEEENLSILLLKKYSLKIKQKILLNSINKETFIFLLQNLIKKESNLNSDIKKIKEIFLLFFNFKEEYKNELKFVVQNKITFIELMNNSYKNIKILYKENINQFNEIKKKIMDLIGVDGNKSNKNYINNISNVNVKCVCDINNDEIKNGYNSIIEFVSNCFKRISFKNKIKKINDYIKKKNIKKNSIFLNKILLESSLEEKEQKIINLDIYCKNTYSILEKYKSLKNIENEKEIINMLSVLEKNQIPSKNQFKKEKIKEKEKDKKVIKDKKNKEDKIISKHKDKDKEKEIINEKEKEKEKNKSKKNILSQERNANDKILYIGNKINTYSVFNQSQNQKLKESSFIEIYKNNQLNRNININYTPKIKINTYISFNKKIKTVQSLNNNNKTINPKKKKYLNSNGALLIDKSIEKPKINKIFLPSRFSQKKKSNIINSYSHLLIKEYHKSPTCEINLNNKSFDISEDKILKTEEGSKTFISNFEHNKNSQNIFIKK